MTVVNGYKQNDNEQKIDILNLEELEERAKQIIPTGGFGYIVGGSENNWTLKANRKAFTHKQIVPRALSNIEDPQLDTNVFGIPLKTPIMMAQPLLKGWLTHRVKKIPRRVLLPLVD